jgi:WD40 repeat protein
MVALDSSSRLVSLDPATLEIASRPQLEFTPGESYIPWLGNLAADALTIAIARSSGDRGVGLFDLRNGKLICSVPSIAPWVSMAPKRRLIVTETPNKTATVWQWPEVTVKWVFTNKVSAFPVVIFSPDENFLLTDEQNCLKLWRISGDALQLEHVFNPKRFAVSGTAFSPDGRLAARGQEGGVIKLWAIPSCESVGVLTGHTRDVIAVAFSPDGRTLASMCDDRTLRLWHVATRRELLRFQAPKEDQRIFALLFSPDGRALVAKRFDEDGPINWLWYAPSLVDVDSTGTGN